MNIRKSSLSIESQSWHPSSWKSKPITQQAEYLDKEALSQELEKLKTLPPIVPHEEVTSLKKVLSDVQKGNGFVLQVGDCAEKFSDCNSESIRHKALFYDLLGNLFTKVTNLPTIVIGRMGGQFAKPRSEMYETVNGKKVMSFKGENINGFHHEERTPCPKRLTEGYVKSANVVKDIRKLKDTEVHCHKFNQKIKKMNSIPINSQDLLEQIPISEPIHVDEKINIQRDIYTSHEALMLDYEETQVREVDSKHYNLSAHFVWIGMRTSSVDGAHVEFFRGLENPIGVKLSKEVAKSEIELAKLIEMIKVLNPKNEDGKLVLITRLGARYVEDTLPKIFEAVTQQKLKVLWVVDAVHGNTQKIGEFKTRKLCDVRDEIIKTIKIFREFGARLHGVHLELTPEEVTECIGGDLFEVTEEDLGKNYTSLCDPRLNFSQSLELISCVAKEMSKK